MRLARRRSTGLGLDPFRELEEMNERFNRLFGPVTGGIGERESMALADWMPSVDISETEDAYHIQAELPGVRKEDVHVTLEENLLTLRGERREEKEETGKRFHRREMSYGTFTRRFTMPEDADESKIDAKFSEGVLNVSVGKTEARAPRAKEIEVHS